MTRDTEEVSRLKSLVLAMAERINVRHLHFHHRPRLRQSRADAGGATGTVAPTTAIAMLVLLEFTATVAPLAPLATHPLRERAADEGGEAATDDDDRSVCE